MNIKKICIPLALLTLVLISGCTALGGLFGGDVISVQQSVVQNGERDVIVVKDIMTIPKSPLLPDQQVILSFIIENKDKLKESANVRVDLFNAPTMRNINGQLCNLYIASQLANLNFCCNQADNALCDDGTGKGYCIGSSEDCPIGYTKRGCSITVMPIQISPQQRNCESDQCGVSAGGCKILPGEEKPISFLMKTPTDADIKNIKTDTKLNFKVTYDFDASLNYLVPAITTSEIIKRQRSGDKATLFTTKSYGPGPIQIDVELQGAPYILSDNTLQSIPGAAQFSTTQPETVIFFTIKNKGSGTLVNSEIDSGKMQIIFPPELDVVEGKYSEKFVCTYNGQNTACINSGKDGNQDLGKIPLYRDQSRSSLRFTVKLREPLQEPFRSYQITATTTYDYELRSSVDMTINPFQNV